MIHKNKERRRQVSAVPAIFKAVSGMFRPFPACFSRIGYQPIRPNMVDTARFWPNQPSSARIEANSARIEPHRCKSSRVGVNLRKKKKKADTDRHAGNRIGRRVPRRTRVRHLWCHVRAFYPISKYLTPYAEKFDSLLNLHASSRLLQSFMI